MDTGIRSWLGPIGSCALCEVPLETFRGFADCDLGLGGVRGLVCPRCLEACRLRVGPGHGQVYRLDATVRYVGVDGWSGVEAPDLPGLERAGWGRGSAGETTDWTDGDAPPEDVSGLLPRVFWSDPTRAGRCWKWLRDSEVSGASGPAAIVGWFGRFLGIDPCPAHLPRFMALGFAQGAELGIALEPVRTDFLASADPRLLDLARNRRDQLGPGIASEGLTVLRRWFREVLFPVRLPSGPVSAWATGLVLGHRAIGSGDLDAALLSGVLATAPMTSRFGTQALLYRYADPRVDFWTTFLLCSHPADGLEGVALATGLQGLRLRARRRGDTLRRFLLDVVQNGREQAADDPSLAGEILAGRDASDVEILRRHHVATSGPLGCRARSDRLFRGMRRHLEARIPDMPMPDDVTSGMMLLRHAGEYLWWRGFLEGLEPSAGRKG